MFAQLYSEDHLCKFLQISHSFGLKVLKLLCAYQHRSASILIESALGLFLPSNCTHMLAHSVGSILGNMVCVYVCSNALSMCSSH